MLRLAVAQKCRPTWHTTRRGECKRERNRETDNTDLNNTLSSFLFLPIKATLQTRSIASTATENVEVFVDGKPVMIEKGAAVIQACEKAGVDIPRFCYHQRLAVAGNCRMCIVEIEKMPKPAASCAMPVMPGMKIKTNTPMVKKAREGVMEFLLANHPLDCPICDQGGECDLQDQSVRYGSDRSRFSEYVGKRAVSDKNFGPLVKTSMNRCIHCTRCVRFANEIAGATELGSYGRGNDMEIGTYIEKAISSEMSGNIIDLCPVGALTSKPYAFNARPWELKKTQSIDVHDAVGSSIRVDSRGNEIVRVLPRVNEDVNEEWISDKTRFAYDGLKVQRLLNPMIRKGNEFVPANWTEALYAVADKMQETKPSEMLAVAGSLADAESMVALKDLFNKFGSENLTVDHTLAAGENKGIDIRNNYIFNTGIANIDQADVALLIGVNPRHEAPIVNTRLRKAYLHNYMQIGVVGPANDLTYEYDHISESLSGLEELINNKHAFSKTLLAAKRPVIIIGSGVTDDTAAAQKTFALLEKLIADNKSVFVKDDWKCVNVLQRAASRVAANDIGFALNPLAKPASPPKFVYLLNSDDIDTSQIPSSAFVVYQGHHGDAGAHIADVILPGAAYTEKNATYVNIEGRCQMTRPAVPVPAGAREDWQIIRALSELAGKTLTYDDLASLRERMADISPTLTCYNKRASPKTFNEHDAISGLVKSLGKATPSISQQPLKNVYSDFYLTDPISRASATMAKCSRQFTHKKEAIL